MGPSRSPSPSPPPGSFKRKVRPCARKVERGCCLIATYFPLAFVYGLTTWAVSVDASLGLFPTSTSPDIPLSRRLLSLLGVTMYVLLNTSYTVAVFTDPGSPSQGRGRDRGKYSVLPTSENYDTRELDTITVSSTGGARYCKKCQVPKPDRTHHCSTCKRCVLKMDHHCPWLSTCLGLHNYKAFLLFLIYTSLFCWSCFAGTGYWIYIEIFSAKQYLSQFAPVQTIILAVLSGIIGLVITGFTAWHIYLVLRGQTTIECLEKTRYLSGVRKRVEQVQNAQHKRGQSNGIQDTINRAGGQLLEFHANAVPGALRYEEGEEHRSPTPSVAHPYADQSDTSPAQRALRKTYASYESDRERERYEEYLEDKESAKMPNAFDLGWRRNLFAVLGPNPWLWFLPITNSPGDGWRWEVSQKWMAANEEAARRKERRIQDAQSSFESPNRGGAGRHYDLAHDEDFGLSMQNLRGGRRQRRDFDTVDGETGSFVVSDSEESSES